MADSPSPLDTVLETVKKKTETIANFVGWIAGLIRERKWSELVSLILAGLFLTVLSNEAARSKLTEFFNELVSKWVWWIVLAIGLFLLLAVILAVWKKPSQPTAPPFVERKAIKGLRPRYSTRNH